MVGRRPEDRTEPMVIDALGASPVMTSAPNGVEALPPDAADHAGVAGPLRPGEGPAGPGRRPQVRWATWGRGLLGVVVLGVVLELISRAGLVDRQFLPPFSSIVLQAAELFGQAAFRTALLATVESFLLGTLIAAVLGTSIGVLFGLWDVVYRASRAVVELIRPVPPVALIPLVILVFGNGLEMKLVIIVFAAIWPILFNTMYGVHGVDPLAKDMARSFGKSPWAVVGQVVLPAAGPLMAAGIRIASSIALVVAVTVELIAGGTQGLGAFIAGARASGTEVTQVYAAILVSGLLGLVVNLALGGLERRWFAWSSTKRGQD